MKLETGYRKSKWASRFAMADVWIRTFCEVGSPYEKSRIGTPCEIENWESRVLRISHKSKMPYGCKPREWMGASRASWVNWIRGRISFQGWNLFYPTHFGVQFFLFALKYIMSEIFKNVFQTVDFFLIYFIFRNKFSIKTNFNFFFFIFTSQWRNDFCIYMIDVITFVFMWMTS